jgi:hypothetical protein
MLTARTTTTTRSRAPIWTLDALAERTADELDAIYRAARAPASMRVADGALRGRMLAVRGVPAVLAAPLRRWAASPSFVWDGKTFAATTDVAGCGHNRVYLRGVLGRQDLFPFATSFGASAIDGARTLVLDYDLGVNPPFIRRIHDEIREVSPGVFLGPAMWKRGSERALVLWFALAVPPARREAEPS